MDLVSAPEQVNLDAAPDGSSTAFNQAGISLDGLAQYANLDGGGHSYSANLLGDTVTWDGQASHPAACLRHERGGRIRGSIRNEPNANDLASQRVLHR